MGNSWKELHDSVNEWSIKHAWWWETWYILSICFSWKKIKREKSANSRWLLRKAEEDRTWFQSGKFIMAANNEKQTFLTARVTWAGSPGSVQSLSDIFMHAISFIGLSTRPGCSLKYCSPFAWHWVKPVFSPCPGCWAWFVLTFFAQLCSVLCRHSLKCPSQDTNLWNVHKSG